MRNNAVETEWSLHETEARSEFPFVADDETITRFFEFIAANGFAIDDPVSIEWWRHHGPQFDAQPFPEHN